MSQQTLTPNELKSRFKQNEKRPKLDITNDDKYKRRAVIHATPPVDPARAAKIQNDRGGAVAETVTKLTDKFDGSVEVITYPRPVSLSSVDTAAVMCHVFHISSHFVDGRSLQTEFNDFEGKVIQNGFDLAFATVEDTFPDSYTIEPGDFDLEPITPGGPVTVCRLVNTATKEVSAVGKIESNAMTNVFDALTKANEPFLHQLIAEPDAEKLYITSRLAPLSTRYTFMGDRGFARLLKEGSDADLAKAFKKIGVTSNFNIDLEPYFDIEYKPLINGRTEYTVQLNDDMRKKYNSRAQHRQEITPLKKQVLGHEEFTSLLRGSTDWDDKLKEHDYYGRFLIPPSTLGYFTQQYLHLYDQNPWDHSPIHNAPVFDPRPINGNEITTDWGTPSLDIDEDTRHLLDGSDGHIRLGIRFDNFATACGDDIRRVEQDGDSRPDYELFPDDGFIHMLETDVDGDIVNVDPEWENTSNPANVLTNVERAIAQDRHVILVFETEQKANRAYNILHHTYKELTEYGAHLFQDDAIATIDGETLVTPEDESTWYLTAAEMLVQVIDGEVVTRCPADADLTEVDHGCATARKEENRIVVTTRDGETLTYQSETAFKREWNKVTAPHVPVDISYLQYVSIMYETGKEGSESGEFVEFKPSPAWERHHKKTDRFSEFGVTVTEDFLVEAPGTELKVEDCHPVMMGVYEWSTDKDAPDKNWFSRSLPDHIERKDKGKKSLKDHTWVFSRGLLSPHLSGIDADADFTL